MGDLGKVEMLKTETLNAERAIANSNQPGKSANRFDGVKERMLRKTPRSGGIGRIHGAFHGRARSFPCRLAKIRMLFFGRVFF
jgi:hypothetical protein